MVSFSLLVATALAIIPTAFAAPNALLDNSISTSLHARQKVPWQWYHTGQGTFNCQQQGTKYTCSWNGQPGGGMVAGSGWPAGRKTVHYSGQYNPKGPGYLALYGWTTELLVEFYIVESWDILAPGEVWTLRGSFTSLGNHYDFYTAERVNKPSILGTSTFTQHFSVRSATEKKVGDVSGAINTADHFDAWAKFGYPIGKFQPSMYMVTEAFANGTKLPSGTSTITIS